MAKKNIDLIDTDNQLRKKNIDLIDTDNQLRKKNIVYTDGHHKKKILSQLIDTIGQIFYR
jgi:hypothetical protein